ncbi:TetR/AcrR family transcriptional regulator [Marinomonas sp. 15G1-11]|uniref:TetR/AcrR family transcriptional regulator n=1 Tax=Marinomonas phaeophyticola TaxID=3004091 RepID=A0ABT4JXJ6_9GAMM|nr:TetR/AcrR family transcriptional regulator [Marinomonas sp. 15G1-11]MCZ2723112.1 TetR/AcrR family transcriptional regulator [Marinomonas sp. 15G1-11]
MKNTKSTYHHGDLKQSLVLTATKILKEDGVDGLSMRKLADQVGVSRTAPYHHFKDKTALLCNIAEQGFLLQSKNLSTYIINPKKSNCLTLFKEYVYSYIQFAEEHRETYDLMFGRDIWKAENITDSLKSESKNSFKLWVQWVEILQKEEVLPKTDPPLRVAQTTWATLHGMCRLLIDGIYLDNQDLAIMTQSAINLLTHKNQTNVS